MGFHIETLAIGDELLTGKIADTNSQFVAGQLFANGLVLKAQTVIADNTNEILSGLTQLSKRADAVVVFGGLGPTTDDLTVDCVCHLLETEPVIFPGAKERLERIYAKRNRVVNEDALRQVRYPKLAEPFRNEVGLAPGFTFVFGKCRFYFLPGVPSEMRTMVLESVIPGIVKAAGRTDRTMSHAWHCHGIAESVLQGLMHPVEAALPDHAWIGYRTNHPENQVILYYRTVGGREPAPEFDAICSDIRSAIGAYVYSERQDSLEGVVVESLRERNLKLVLAESCTGGLVAHRLTRIAGSSHVIWGGYTAYRAEAKNTMLGVRVRSEAAAVSQSCTLNLALRALAQSGCDVAAAITGYMGPNGGTETDPIGTIYTAVVSAKDRVESRQVLDRPERERKQWTASAVLLGEIFRFIQAD